MAEQVEPLQDRLYVRIDSHLKGQIALAAAAKGMGWSEWVRDSLQRAASRDIKHSGNGHGLEV